MLDSLFDSGKLGKMIIRAYETVDGKPELTDDDNLKYQLQVNPESYSIKYNPKYVQIPGIGNSGSEAKYVCTLPQVLEFNFLFDGTGVIPPVGGTLDNVPIAGAVADLFSDDKGYDVTDELSKFAHVCYDYSGEIHKPRNLQLAWGTLVFNCVLIELQLEYTLFKPDGTPLRAIANATFEGTIDDTLREKKENKSSPDLTHKRSVRAGDTLPLLAHSIYRNSAYYLEVARSNKLYGFRRLKEGSEIAFPPLDKSRR
jgi:hypothetical protein